RSSATVAHARLVRLEAGRARIRSAGLREAAQLACTRAKDVCHRSDRAYADFASHLIALPSWPPDNGGALHRRLPAHVASVTLARCPGPPGPPRRHALARAHGVRLG